MNERLPTLNLPSVFGATNRFVTVPVYTTVNKEIADIHYTERNSKNADVEKPILEADKDLLTTTNNSGADFDPQQIYSTPKFKKQIKPILRIIRNPASKMAAPYPLARQDNYVYMAGNRNYQSRYYTNNHWLDTETGRICLFEKQGDSTRLV